MMRQEIKIVSAPSATELESAVNALLQEGWQLHGGPIVTNSKPPIYLQAVVRMNG
jgi:hypothetical protein